MQRDTYLVKKLSELRLPLWVLLFPVVGNLVYASVYKAWMLGYSDPDWFWKRYWRMVNRTSGAYFFTVVALSLFAAAYWPSLLTVPGDYHFALPLFWGIVCFLVIGNVVYQPFNLKREPKRVVRDFRLGYGDAERLEEEGFSCPYDLGTFIDNLSSRFNGLTCFTLFSADLGMREVWLRDAISGSRYDNGFKVRTTLREFLSAAGSVSRWAAKYREGHGSRISLDEVGCRHLIYFFSCGV